MSTTAVNSEEVADWASIVKVVSLLAGSAVFRPERVTPSMATHVNGEPVILKKNPCKNLPLFFILNSIVINTCLI